MAAVSSSSSGKDSFIPNILLVMTLVTGIVDAVSWLGLGRVFTNLQTGNLVVLAFAISGASGFSTTHNIATLVSFFVGALAGGRLIIRLVNERDLILFENMLEASALAVIGVLSFGFNSASGTPEILLYTMIVLLAVAMGLRSAVVKKLSIPDMLTTLPTFTMTGILSDLSSVHGKSPHVLRRAYEMTSTSFAASFKSNSISSKS